MAAEAVEMVDMVVTAEGVAAVKEGAVVGVIGARSVVGKAIVVDVGAGIIRAVVVVAEAGAEGEVSTLRWRSGPRRTASLQAFSCDVIYLARLGHLLTASQSRQTDSSTRRDHHRAGECYRSDNP